jgi:hypothetical protein
MASVHEASFLGALSLGRDIVFDQVFGIKLLSLHYNLIPERSPDLFSDTRR